ncbi:organic cation transporter protein-like [Mya arenaria]|uniref:organic cation transporter protein-like n=1 Tax=Mya arenaria TaxID=6604 RepID=UPI0022E23469|nr:organic cation transporter protein-like [Mya arenaria]
MKFDDITVLLGEFGKYQKILYFLVCLPAIFTGMQMLSSVFTLAIPDHRCALPGLGNDTYEVQGQWHKLLINQSITWETGKDDEGSLVYSSCDRYVTNENTSYNAHYIPVNTSTTECDTFVFDQSTFKNTFITKTNLVCGNKLARANANMILMGGKLFGSIAIGVFSDIFGRKKAVMLSSFLHIGAAFGSAFAPNYGAFVIFRFVQGASNSGIFMSLFVIGVELVGPSYRVAAGIIIEFFWCIGLFLLCLVAYFVRTWNILLLVLACPTVLLVFYFWLIPESPRWLITRGKYEEAEKIIRKCAKVNKVELPEKVIDADSMEEGGKESILRMITVPRLLIRTIIIYLNWVVVSMVYYGLGLNVGNLDGDIYTNFAINSTMEVGAYILCLVLLNRVGRKALHCGTMILGGGACLCTIFTVLYADKSLYWITVVLSNIGKFGISAAYAIIYVWSAELFPTLVRNSGMGSSSMLARVGGIISPYIADLGTFVEGDFGKALPLIIFGGLSVVAGFLSLFLPETNGQVLPETIEDAVNFGRTTPDSKTKDVASKYFVNDVFTGNVDSPTEEKKNAEMLEQNGYSTHM